MKKDSRYSTLKALIKRTFASVHIISVLVPQNFHRLGQKQPDHLTLDPWVDDRQFLWDVAVVGSLVPSRMSAGLVCNSRTAAVEAKDSKTNKCGD